MENKRNRDSELEKESFPFGTGLGTGLARANLSQRDWKKLTLTYMVGVSLIFSTLFVAEYKSLGEYKEKFGFLPPMPVGPAVIMNSSYLDILRTSK